MSTVKDLPQRKICARQGSDDDCAARKSKTPGLGELSNVGRLRTFLSLDDFKLNLIALLQALIAFAGDGAVMDEHVRPIVAPQETISLCVVKPLYRALYSFHVLSPISTTFLMSSFRNFAKLPAIVKCAEKRVKGIDHTGMWQLAR